jgi:hypothetical protein
MNFVLPAAWKSTRPLISNDLQGISGVEGTGGNVLGIFHAPRQIPPQVASPDIPSRGHE